VQFPVSRSPSPRETRDLRIDEAFLGRIIALLSEKTRPKKDPDGDEYRTGVR
jgi:hypothetical protein